MRICTRYTLYSDKSSSPSDIVLIGGSVGASALVFLTTVAFVAGIFCKRRWFGNRGEC